MLCQLIRLLILFQQNATPSENSVSGSIFRDRAYAAEAECISLKAEIENLQNHNVALQDKLECTRGGTSAEEKSLILQYKVVSAQHFIFLNNSYMMSTMIVPRQDVRTTARSHTG
jgi:hypothetical protein